MGVPRRERVKGKGKGGIGNRSLIPPATSRSVGVFLRALLVVESCSVSIFTSIMETMDVDIDFLLSLAKRKLYACRFTGDIHRDVLLTNLKRKLRAARKRLREEGDRRSCCGDGANGRRCQKRRREGGESSSGSAKRSCCSGVLSWRVERVRDFIAGLAPCRVNWQALEEELGPEPDIELLDD